jgi:predicted dehydrogenase
VSDSPSSTLRIGVLGAARITPSALIHPARHVEGVEVVAVAARDPSRARAFATKWEIPEVVGSYEALVDHDGLDAVYNPLPNGLHARWTTAALEAGRHVLCEKPLTSNATQAREVAAAADASGRVLMEAFHYRYHPLMAEAVEVVRRGELGELRRVEAWMQVPLLARHDIRFDLDLAGGATMDLGCYAIHQIRSLTGEEPTVLAARAKERSAGVDRWMQADLRFPGGADARFTVSFYGARLLRLGFRVTGTKGELRVLNPTIPHYFHRLRVRTTDGTTRRERFARVPTYRYQLEAFRDAVRDGTPVLTGPADSVANMEVIDAVYEAAGLPLRP